MRPYAKKSAGTWVVQGSKRSHPTYRPAVKRTLNSLDPLFHDAKSKCESEYIFTLLRVSGVQDPGWDTLETLRKVFESFNKLQRTHKTLEDTVHYSLFLYGLIVEASAMYDIIANLLNIIEGGRYKTSNFSDDIGPGKKIAFLSKKAQAMGYDLSFLQDAHDSILRNAIFHSDYSVYGSEVRIAHRQHIQTYSRDDWHRLVNCTIAYYETMTLLVARHRAAYRKPKVVDLHADFSTIPNEKAITVIRDGDGVIALRDNFTEQEVSSGTIPWWMGRVLPYESKLITKRQLILPRNRIAKVNKMLKWLPKIISAPLANYFSSKFSVR